MSGTQERPTPGGGRHWGLALVAVAVLGAVVLALWRPGARPQDEPAPQTPQTLRQQLARLPQRDTLLGQPAAPVRLLEFADLRCEACQHFARTGGRLLLERYIASGKLSWQLEALGSARHRSLPLAQAAYAAAAQGQYWPFVLTALEGGGEPRAVAAQLPGLHLPLWERARFAPLARMRAARANRWADRLQVDRTPSFFLSVRGGPWRRWEPERRSAAAFAASLQDAGIR